MYLKIVKYRLMKRETTDFTDNTDCIYITCGFIEYMFAMARLPMA